MPPAYFDKKIKPSWYSLTFLLKDNYLDNNGIKSFLSYFHDKGLVDIDNPGSTKPLNLLPLFQKPEALFPVYKNKNNKF